MRTHPLKSNGVDYKVEMEDAKPGITYVQTLRVSRNEFLFPVAEAASRSAMVTETPLRFQFEILPRHESHTKAKTSGPYAYDEAILQTLKEKILGPNIHNYPIDADGVRHVTL